MSESQKRYAIIVGVRSYGDANQNDLRYTGNDAQDLCAALLDRAGFAKENVHLFCDKPQGRFADLAREPKRSDILSTLKEVAESALDTDLVLFYFAGHGAEISGSPYLITNDTRMNVVKDTALDVLAVNEYFQKCRASHIVRLFDACRIGMGSRGGSERMSQGLANSLLKKNRGWLTFSSCSSCEVAYEHEDLKHGVFSYYLIEGIRGAAKNEEGTVTLDGLVSYVKICVANWAKQQSASQTPHSVSDLSGTLALVSGIRPEATRPSQPVEDRGADFHSRLDALVARTSAEARALRTTEGALDTFAGIWPYVSEECRILEGTRLTVNVSSSSEGVGRGTVAYPVVQAKLAEGTIPGSILEALASHVDFRPKASMLPGVHLWICLARFDLFYALIYGYKYFIEGRNPSPQTDSRDGSFIILPAAISDEGKMRGIVRQIVGLLSSDYLEWADFAMKYFEERAKELKKGDNLVV